MTALPPAIANVIAIVVAEVKQYRAVRRPTARVRGETPLPAALSALLVRLSPSLEGRYAGVLPARIWADFVGRDDHASTDDFVGIDIGLGS